MSEQDVVDATGPLDGDADAEAADRWSGSVWTEPRGLRPVAAWVLLVAGVLGLAAAGALTIERIELLINPSASLSCNFNPIISCGNVMTTEQAKFFGFPNPILGLPAFAVIIVTAILSIGRVKLPRWYWVGQSIGTALGWVFVHYLIFQSMFRIGALCPYCMVVWTITPVILVLSVSRALPDSALGRSVREWMWVLLPVWYVAVIVTGGVKFWDYWQTLF
ncbi:vitamin K epoxide reductase family protein [Gordonia humi]|uniref:Putative membrane protein n=1 Tax=Gordonia humi TaxID=686429 RepID=A0A840F1M0_9ACTN|nr:vitamin K epoxide reductase family protein [Gordonia humi]MBB4135269.1 putative membrane protein [Gordonia humi]